MIQKILLGQKKLNALKKIRLVSRISEQAGNKKEYANIGRSFLRQLLTDIGVRLAEKYGTEIAKSKVSYSPGTPLSAGEVSLRFIISGGGGIAVYINNIGSDLLLCHAIKSMKDNIDVQGECIKVNEAYESIVVEVINIAVKGRRAGAKRE